MAIKKMWKKKSKCKTCGTEFKRKKDYKYHNKGCKECTCDECRKTFNHGMAQEGTTY